MFEGIERGRGMNSREEILALQGETVVKFDIDRRESKTFIDMEFNNTAKKQRKSMRWYIDGQPDDITIIESMMRGLLSVKGQIWGEGIKKVRKGNV